MNSKTFCLAPWTHALVHTDATMRTCCATKKKSTIKFTDYESWWNSTDMVSLRQDLHNGIKNAHCSSCWHTESLGKESVRNNYNNLFRKYANFNTIRESSKKDFKSSDLPTTWDLRLGNICNLKCVMCNPEFSHLIQQEIQKFQPIIPQNLKLESNNSEIANWSNTQQGLNFLNKIIKDVRWLKLQGGEPLAIKNVQDVITNLNKDAVLAVTTNGTILTDALDKILKDQTRVEISVSVESAGPANDIIRYGSDWKVIDANIQKIKNYPRGDLQLNHTLQLVSVFHLPDVIRYCEKNNLHVMLINLTSPDYLSLRACPKKYLDQLVEEVCSIDIQHPKNQYIKTMIKNIVDQTEFDIDLWYKFWAYVEYLDQIRPDKFSTVLPTNFKKDLI